MESPGGLMFQLDDPECNDIDGYNIVQFPLIENISLLVRDREACVFSVTGGSIVMVGALWARSTWEHLAKGGPARYAVNERYAFSDRFLDVSDFDSPVKIFVSDICAEDLPLIGCMIALLDAFEGMDLFPEYVDISPTEGVMSVEFDTYRQDGVSWVKEGGGHRTVLEADSWIVQAMERFISCFSGFDVTRILNMVFGPNQIGVSIDMLARRRDEFRESDES